MEQISMSLLVRCAHQPIHEGQVALANRLAILVKQGLVRRYKDKKPFFKITAKGKRYLVNRLDYILANIGISDAALKQLLASTDTAHLVRFLVHDNEFVRKFAAQCIPLDEN